LVDWCTHFAEILVAGDAGEANPAASAAGDAERCGAARNETAAAGKAAAKQVPVSRGGTEGYLAAAGRRA